LQQNIVSLYMLSQKLLFLFLLMSFCFAFQKPQKSGKSSKNNTSELTQDSVKTNIPLPKKIVWLEIVAGKNETFATIFERYDLGDFDCNMQKFRKLNELKENSKIKSGKIYKLPVFIVKYNGKNIRSTLNIKDLNIAKRIEIFNKNAYERGTRDDNYTESKNLWIPWDEVQCPAKGELGEQPENEENLEESNIIEDKTAYIGKRTFPIFGKKYEKTPLIDKKLKGKVFYIISGHGGPDVGAEGKRESHTLCEDEYAYDVALRLVRLLVSHGATAYMIVRDPNDGIRDEEYLDCDKDEVVWGNLEIPRPQKKRLFQRSDLINKMTDKNLASDITDQTVVEIHVDSRSRNARTDVFFYHRSGSEESELLAKKMHKTFKQKYLKVRAQRSYNGTVTPRDLHTLRETHTKRAVYVELGNIRNFHDQHRLVLAKNRQVLANWLGESFF
jgi:N-acetylmuramoyl-L-alanine amidase